MIVIGTLIATLLLGTILLPFFIGSEELLQTASLTNSKDRLKAEKKAIVARYIADEAAFEKKIINRIMWEQRRQYLVSRYIDAARRLDFLLHTENLTQNDQEI